VGSSPGLTVGTHAGYDDVLIGKSIDLLPTDFGWQDTAWVAPGQSLTLIARFDLPGEYVWYCHILSHQDNEMMRPYEVVSPAK